MRKIMSAVLAGVIATTSVAAFTAPAEARDRHRHHRHHDDGDGAAIAAGVIGLLLGAALVSSSQSSSGPTYSGGYDDGYGYDNGGSRYRGDAYYDTDYDRACAARYWSYDPTTQSYKGADGRRYRCQL